MKVIILTLISILIALPIKAFDPPGKRLYQSSLKWGMDLEVVQDSLKTKLEKAPRLENKYIVQYRNYFGITEFEKYHLTINIWQSSEEWFVFDKKHGGGLISVSMDFSGEYNPVRDSTILAEIDKYYGEYFQEKVVHLPNNPDFYTLHYIDYKEMTILSLTVIINKEENHSSIDLTFENEIYHNYVKRGLHFAD